MVNGISSVGSTQTTKTLNTTTNTVSTNNTTTANTTQNTATSTPIVRPDKLSNNQDVNESKTEAYRRELQAAKARINSLQGRVDTNEEKVDEKQDNLESYQAELSNELSQAQYYNSALSSQAAQYVKSSISRATQDAKNGKGNFKDLLIDYLGDNGIDTSIIESSLSRAGNLKGIVGDITSEINSLNSQINLDSMSIDQINARYGGILNATGVLSDFSNVTINSAGAVTINEFSASSISASGLSGISSMDMATYATMTQDEIESDISSNAALMQLAQQNGLTAKDFARAVIDINNNIPTTSKTNQYLHNNDTGKVVNYRTIGDLSADKLIAKARELKPLTQTSTAGGGNEGGGDGSGGGDDPYTVKINGLEYIFATDSNNNNILDDISEVLGNDEEKSNLFQSMRELDSDKNGAVSSQELKDKNVKLYKLDENHKATNEQFSLDNVKGVNLNSFVKSNDNNGETGTFGTYSMTLQNNQVVEGKETFENQAYFDNLLNKSSESSTSNSPFKYTNAITPSARKNDIPEISNNNYNDSINLDDINAILSNGRSGSSPTIEDEKKKEKEIEQTKLMK